MISEDEQMPESQIIYSLGLFQAGEKTYADRNSSSNKPNLSQKTMPQGKHSKLQVGLSGWINLRGEPNCLVYALTELRCTLSERSIVPDIAVFAWDRIPVDGAGEIINKITIAPNWIIEILSPDRSPIQTIEKISFAIKNGIKLGWLIAEEE